MSTNAPDLRIANRAPAPWDSDAIPDGYELRFDGTLLVSVNSGKSERIAGPVWVSAFTEDKGDRRFGFVLKWLDRRRNIQERAFPMEMLHEQGRGLVMTLANSGLEIPPGKERALITYLGHFDSDKTNWIQSVPQLGWVSSQSGELAYMLANADVIAASGYPPVIFQPEQNSPTVQSMHSKGSLDAWNESVVGACKGNPFLIFSLCVGFAGPLLKQAQLESGGFHLFGRSSHGKTTAAQVAASVFGCGSDPSDAPEHSYVQRWNSTKNAYEALLAAHNDSVLILDEIHTADDRDFGSVIYNLAGGKGKQSLSRNRQLRAPRSWRALILSTGEISVRQKIEQDRRSPHAGQLLRMIDVPTDSGIILQTNGQPPGEFARRLKLSCGKHYGTAGPTFIRELVSSYEDSFALSATIKQMLEAELTVLVPSDVAPEQRRGLQRFALLGVAGRLASSLGVFSMCSGEIQEAIARVSSLWLQSSGNIPDHIRGALAVRDFIMRDEARFRDIVPNPDAPRIRDLAGYRDRNRGLFLFTHDGFQEACGEANTTDVARVLASAGYLRRGEANRFTTKQMVDGHRPRLYAIYDRIIGYDPSGGASVVGSGATGAEGEIEA